MKRLILPLLLAAIALSAFYVLPRYTKNHSSVSVRSKPLPKVKKDEAAVRLKSHAANAKEYALKNNLSTRYAFLIDMSLHSGRKRFFVYDFNKDSVVASGLVAHGSCNSFFVLEKVKFSNTSECGCSSQGHYKVGIKYNGRFGKAYKLHGLDETNSNAYKRAIVLHAYDCVPDSESFPEPLCNSLGCPMVSYSFLDRLSPYIDKSDKSVLLWIYS